MKTTENTKENAKHAAACAFMLPGICAGLALLLAGGADGFGAMFARVFGFGVGALWALVAWKI